MGLLRWWWVHGKAMRGCRRWNRLVSRLREMECPKTLGEYFTVHRMFTDVARRNNDWCVSFVYPYGEVKDMTAQEAWENLIGRMDYAEDRMNWRRFTELTEYLRIIEDHVLKEEWGIDSQEGGEKDEM